MYGKKPIKEVIYNSSMDFRKYEKHYKISLQDLRGFLLGIAGIRFTKALRNSIVDQGYDADLYMRIS